MPRHLPSAAAASLLFITTVSLHANDISAPETAQASEFSRIIGNFFHLMGQQWQTMLAFAGWVIVTALIWGLMLLVLGAIVGLVMYLIARRRGWLAAPWKGYRYAAWVWPIVLIFCAASGMGYAGLWLGGGRCVKRYIVHERMLDKITANILCAVALDATEYELRDGDIAAKYELIMADSHAVAQLARADFERGFESLIDNVGDNRLLRWFLSLSAETAGDSLTEKLHGIDPRLLIVVFMAHPSIDEYLARHPDAHPAVMALAGHFDHARAAACDLVNGVVYPNAAAGIALGLGIPLLLIALLRLAVWKWPGPPLPHIA